MSADFFTAIKEMNYETLQSKANYLNTIDKDSRDALVMASYSYLIDFTSATIKNRMAINNDETIIVGLAHMVYGWMPTMIRLHREKMANPSVWLDQALSSAEVNEHFLQTTMDFVNNSIIGASKLLHFINPQRFAIFDSRVYRSIIGANSASSTINDLKKYQAYNTKLLELAAQPEKIPAISWLDLESKTISAISPLRRIELILFLSTSVVIGDQQVNGQKVR